MYFKPRYIKFKFIPRIHYRRCIIRLGRIFLLILLIWAYLFIQTLRKNGPATKLRSHNFSQASLSQMIKDFNSEENIINKESYGKIKEDTVIFVVLADGFSEKIRIFLASLSDVKGMEDALIIFSHYYYDETLNNIIGTRYFYRVLQIFYPYSVQTHPREYPVLNNDRPHNKSEQTTQQTKFKNPHFQDIHGHYENGKKHHWWWTANHVFETLKCTKKHTGLVMFMKDDLIFTKDFIYMAMYMKNIARSQPRCEFVSMGTHFFSDTKYSASDIYSATLTVWNPKIHSSVLAFDVTTWNIIAAHYELYCDFNDTSWSRSLYYISLHRMDNLYFFVLSSKVPRAFKISPCKWFCDENADVDKLTKFEYAPANIENWFPLYVELHLDIGMDDIPRFASKGSKPPTDHHDRALCYNMSASKIKKVIMAINN